MPWPPNCRILIPLNPALFCRRRYIRRRSLLLSSFVYTSGPEGIIWTSYHEIRSSSLQIVLGIFLWKELYHNRSFLFLAYCMLQYLGPLIQLATEPSPFFSFFLLNHS
jgi:hypothetical protein